MRPGPAQGAPSEQQHQKQSPGSPASWQLLGPPHFTANHLYFLTWSIKLNGSFQFSRSVVSDSLRSHELQPLGFPVGTSDKEPTCQCRRHKRHGFNLWVEPMDSHTPAARSFPGENARSWGALGEARPGQEVPCSALKGDTVLDTLDATAKVPRHAGFPRGEHRGSRHRLGEPRPTLPSF